MKKINVIIIASLILAACGGGSSGSGSNQPTPQLTEPVLLEGNPDSLALEALIDKRAGPARPDEIEDWVILTRIDAMIKDQATVKQVNQALQVVQGGLITMLKMDPIITLQVPKQSNLEAVRQVVAQLKNTGAFEIVLPGFMAYPNITPGPPLDEAANHPVWNHLHATRFPAAWNVMNSVGNIMGADACGGVKIPVIILDYFEPDPPPYFNERIPNFSWAFQGQAAPETAQKHGYKVTTMVTGTWWLGESPIGANPLPHCLDIIGTDVYGHTYNESLMFIDEVLNKYIYKGKTVINQSLGFYPQLTLQERFERLTLFHHRLGRYLEVADMFFTTSAGNAKDENILNGFKLSRYSSDCNMSTIDHNTLFRELTQADLFGNQVFSNQDAEQQKRIFENNRFPVATNVLMVGSVNSRANSIFGDLAQESSFSNSEPHVMTVGEDVDFNGENGQGTSVSNPQVAGLVSYLWLLSPDLKEKPVQKTKELIIKNVWPNTLTVDAYASVLSLDKNEIPTPDSARMRLALLDVSRNGRFDERDIEELINRGVENQERGLLDYSRYDLNGDGYTGGSTRGHFDLDRVGSEQYGTTNYSDHVEQNIEGQVRVFDENLLTDRDILLYYAYSPLYTPSEEGQQQDRRGELLRPVLQNLANEQPNGQNGEQAAQAGGQAGQAGGGGQAGGQAGQPGGGEQQGNGGQPGGGQPGGQVGQPQAAQRIHQSTLSSKTSNIRIANSIYENGHPTTGEQGSVVDMASSKQHLYVSWRDGDGDQHLDVFNSRDPRHAEIIETRNFGNINDNVNAHLKQPRDMRFADGVLTFLADARLKTFGTSQDGRLEPNQEFQFIDSADSGLNRLSHGGNYASAHRKFLTDRTLVDLFANGANRAQVDALAFGEAYLNLVNPKSPFLLKKHHASGSKLFKTPTPISGALNGTPVAAAVDPQTLQLTTTTYGTQLQTHVNTFWGPKISDIFNADVLNLSLRDIFANIIGRINLPEINIHFIDEWIRELGFEENATLADLILEKYRPGTRIDTILNDYGIKPEDHVDVALEKIVDAHISVDLDKALARFLYSRLLQKWREEFFNFEDRSFAELRRTLINAMNSELFEAGVETYLVRNVVAPMLDNPDYLRLKLKDVVGNIANNEVSQLVEQSLNTYHGIARDQDIFEIAHDMGVDVNPPACFVIPEHATQFLELALYGHGAHLKKDGLALMELIKLVQYYVDQDNDYAQQYRNTVNEIDQRLQQFHEAVTDNVYWSLFSTLSSILDGNVRLSEFLDRYAEMFTIKKTITVSVSESIKQTLEAAGVQTDVTVKELLETYRLYGDVIRQAQAVAAFKKQVHSSFKMQPAGIMPQLLAQNAGVPAGAPQYATVQTLIEVMNELRLARYSMNTLLNNAKQVTQEPIRQMAVQFLGYLTNEIFGPQPLDMTLNEAIARYLSTQIDPHPMGAFFKETFNTLLKDFAADTAMSYLGPAGRAVKGDCIAQWQTIYRTITNTLRNIPREEAQATAALSEAMDQALEQAYNKVINYFVGQMITELAQQTMINAVEDYPSWISKLSENTSVQNLPELSSFRPTLTDTFFWKDKAAIVLRNVGAMGPHPIQDATGKVALLLFNPQDIEGTLQEIDLGQWSTVHKVIQGQRFILIGGTMPLEGQNETLAMVIDVEQNPIPYQIVGNQALSLSTPESMVIMNGGSDLAVRTSDQKIFFLSLPRDQNMDIMRLPINLQ